MKKLLLFSLFVLFIYENALSQNYLKMIESRQFTVNEIIKDANKYFENKEKGRGTGYKQFKRWEYQALRNMNENAWLPSQKEMIGKLQSFNSQNNNTDKEISLADNWVELGPKTWHQTTAWNPGVGRVTGIAIDKTNSNHILVGANTGGVWRTIDRGLTWTVLTDNFINLNVFSVTIDPQDSMVYYFGSNEGMIYKSLDQGATWNALADIGNSIVNKILIHPTNSNILFASSQSDGIFKSSDAGASWTKITYESSGYDIEFKPGDPSVVYVAGNEFFKSTDAGSTFTKITGFSYGPKMIAVSIDDPSYVYVVEASGGTFAGFYISTNEGDNFTKRDHTGMNYFGYSTTANDSYGQAPRDMDVTVNPNNVDEVHIAGVLTWRSLDAGFSFTCTSDWVPQNAAAAGLGYCHADVDIMLFDDNTLFVGTDGGIFKATNTTLLNQNYYTDLTEGIGIRQFYKIGISQTPIVVVSGGAQDNGTSFYKEGDVWKDWLGADGMETFIDKDNKNVMYGTSQFGWIYRTDNAAASIVNLPRPGVGTGNWVTPFEKDPAATNTIYVCYNRVHKSSDKGNTWSAISQNFGSAIDHLKIAESNNQIMYLAFGDELYKTTNGGFSDWAQMTTPGGLINSIAIHPTNPNKIAVATIAGDKVFVSSDGGNSWVSYLKNLPDFSALALIWDANGQDGLYLGMNYGIFYIDNTFTDWQTYSNMLPNVNIAELEINRVKEKIYAGTYGRGLWASPTAYSSIGVKEHIKQNELLIYPNPVKTHLNLSINTIKSADVKIFDINGKLVYYKHDFSFSNKPFINISKLNKGVYFIRINSDKGVLTKKFIKE